ncbi:MAG: dihydrolipoyl dehydrogenase [Candidatus Bathyarchaeota archaeon]|nr:MAG: dihydrolipoyl dehydrogenase [Candidatus Bathyarchaeota archaeon]
MKEYDVLVVGSGSGMSIADAALNGGMEVAVVESGPLGGTCLNRGCIPSKMVIYPADVINIIWEAGKLGVKANINEIDFAHIMDRSQRLVEEDRRHMELGVQQVQGLTLYNEVGEFVSDYTMEVSGETIRAENIFIVSGARPRIPSIKGIEEVSYLTSKNVWGIREKPESILIVGGGFVAVEFAHFFSSVGSRVTLLSRSSRLIKFAEPEVSELLGRAMGRMMEIHYDVEAVEASESGELKELVTVNKGTGERRSFRGEVIMIAAGRRSNADLLKPERTGVKLDRSGFIIVNEYLETGKPRIWAFGDAIGKHMFKHVANLEAGVAWNNFAHKHKEAVDYSAVPYAVFTHPQVASVGLTERQALEKGHDILVGTYDHRDTAKGAAMGTEEGFVKIIVDAQKYMILGGSIIGPYAPILMQEVINAMNTREGTIESLQRAMYIHPAAPEVVQRAAFNLRRPGHGPHHH